MKEQEKKDQQGTLPDAAAKWEAELQADLDAFQIYLRKMGIA